MIDNSSKVIKHKVGLLNLAEELGNVSKACKAMGLSRDIFYRYQAAFMSWNPNKWLDYYNTERTHQGKMSWQNAF